MLLKMVQSAKFTATCTRCNVRDFGTGMKFMFMFVWLKALGDIHVCGLPEVVFYQSGASVDTLVKLSLLFLV